jgi:RNA-dependent RNA polymerase
LIKAGYHADPLVLDIAAIIECRALQDLKWKARVKLDGGVFLIGEQLRAVGCAAFLICRQGSRTSPAPLRKMRCSVSIRRVRKSSLKSWCRKSSSVVLLRVSGFQAAVEPYADIGDSPSGFVAALILTSSEHPSLMPNTGDVRRTFAVDRPELRHLKNVIVFSVKGDRDLPNMSVVSAVHVMMLIDTIG